MKTVIITRPEPDGSQFAAMLEAHALNSILSPVMEIRFLDRAPDLSGVTALAFTSANGVRAFMHASERAKMNFVQVRRLPVFAIGDATARCAREGRFGRVYQAAGDGESLARLVIETVCEAGANNTALVYHGAGSIRQGDLVKRLEEAGLNARRQVLYNAASNPHLSRTAEAALRTAQEGIAVVFFSPRSARLFMQQVTRADLATSLSSVTALCLSAAIAEELDPPLWKTIEIAANPSADALRDLLTP